MNAALRSTINDPEIEEGILIDAADHLDLDREDLQADFEHGQWWITHRPSGAQWSVVDCESIDGAEYFGFEQVSRGEDE